MTAPDPVQECLKIYQEVTGLELKAVVWKRAVNHFLASGFTLDDLKLVLLHLVRENKRMNGAKFSLRLNSLLDYKYERFDSFLAEAKAVERNRVVRTEKDKVLQAWRGLPTDTQTGNTAQHVSDCLKKLKEAL